MSRRPPALKSTIRHGDQAGPPGTSDHLGKSLATVQSVDNDNPPVPIKLRQRVDPGTLLEVIAEFRCASLGLLAWEFSVPDSALSADWEVFIRDGLISPSGVDPVMGETMYELSGAGKVRLKAATGVED